MIRLDYAAPSPRRRSAQRRRWIMWLALMAASTLGTVALLNAAQAWSAPACTELRS